MRGPIDGTAISRGGVSSWYRHVVSSYENLDTIPPMPVKQRGIHIIDRDVIAGRPFLHPSQMYRDVEIHRDIEAVKQHCRYERFLPIERPHIELPDHYVVVRFYDRDPLAYTQRRYSLIEQIVKSYKLPVVGLVGPQVDDHIGIDFPCDVTVSYADCLLDNLDLQTRVVANADAAVMTYGGYSYLPAMYGVPTIAICGNRKSRQVHTDAIMYAVQRLDTDYRMVNIS